MLAMSVSVARFGALEARDAPIALGIARNASITRACKRLRHFKGQFYPPGLVQKYIQADAPTTGN